MQPTILNSNSSPCDRAKQVCEALIYIKTTKTGKHQNTNFASFRFSLLTNSVSIFSSHLQFHTIY